MTDLNEIYDDGFSATTARIGFQQSLTLPEKREDIQAQKAVAETCGMPEDMAAGITPEKIVEAKLRHAANWGAIAKNSPNVAARLSNNPRFAVEVGGLPGVQEESFLEAAARKIAESRPEEGSVLAAVGRGLAGLKTSFSSADTAQNIQNLQAFKANEAKLAAGAGITEVFGEGEEGMDAYNDFLAMKKGGYDTTRAQVVQDLQTIKRIEAITAKLGVSEATRKFQEAEGFTDAAQKFFAHPTDILKDVGIESFVQFAPAIGAMAVAGATGGVGGAALAQGAFSYMLESGSQINSTLSELMAGGKSPEEAVALISDPARAAEFEAELQKDRTKGFTVGLFDAASMPVAGKAAQVWGRVFGTAEKIPGVKAGVEAVASRAKLPEAVTQAINAHPKMAELARRAGNGVLEMQTQGLIGGAGEAASQIVTEGRVTSWSDVIAEYAGEHFTAPFEAAIAGTKYAQETARVAAKATQTAQTVKQIVDVVKKSDNVRQALKTTQDIIKQAGDVKISISGASLKQEEAEKLIAVMPERTEEIQKAVADGSDINMTLAEFATTAAPNLGEDIAERVSVNGSLSAAEAVMQNDNAAEVMKAAIAAADEERKRGKDATFKREVRELTQVMETRLTSAFTPTAEQTKYQTFKGRPWKPEEIKANASLISHLVATVALDAGEYPKSTIARFGLPSALNEETSSFLNEAGAKERPQSLEIEAKPKAVSDAEDTSSGGAIVPNNGNSENPNAQAEGFSNNPMRRKPYDYQRTEPPGAGTEYANPEFEEHRRYAEELRHEQPRSFVEDFRAQGADEKTATRSGQIKAVQLARVLQFLYDKRGLRHGEGNGLAVTSVWSPSEGLRQIYNLNGIATPDLYELAPTAENAQIFADAITASKEGNKYGAAVDVYAVDKYQEMRLFLTEDRMSGVAIKSNGDIVSVFNDKRSGRDGAAYPLLDVAISNGGRKLDCFDTVLPKLYGAHGFRVVSRSSWNEEYRPEGWEEKTFEKYNNGHPDVTYMVLDNSYLGTYQRTEGKKIEKYDDVVAEQEKALKAFFPEFYKEESSGGTLGQYFPDINAISLAAGADRSTFLHETGHWYLDFRTHVVAGLLEGGHQLTTTQIRLVDTTAAAVRWLAADRPEWQEMDNMAVLKAWDALSLEEKRPMHEKFARNYEAYLMTGEAPTKGLRALFRKFSGWLKAIYTSIAGIPGQELNPEVKALYDDLFTAYADVREAQLRRDGAAAFHNKQYVNQTESLTSYAGDVEISAEEDENIDAAVEELLARRRVFFNRLDKLRDKTARQVRRADREALKRLREEERQKFNESKAGKAIDALMHGLPDADGVKHNVKIPRAELAELFGTRGYNLGKRLQQKGIAKYSKNVRHYSREAEEEKEAQLRELELGEQKELAKFEKQQAADLAAYEADLKKAKAKDVKDEMKRLDRRIKAKQRFDSMAGRYSGGRQTAALKRIEDRILHHAADVEEKEKEIERSTKLSDKEKKERLRSLNESAKWQTMLFENEKKSILATNPLTEEQILSRMERLRQKGLKAIAAHDAKFDKEQADRLENFKKRQAAALERFKTKSKKKIDEKAAKIEAITQEALDKDKQITELEFYKNAGLTADDINEDNIEYINEWMERYTEFENSIDGEFIADKLGYGSLSELVDDLLEYADPDAVIEARAQERLEAAFEHEWAKEAKELADRALINKAGENLAALQVQTFEELAKMGTGTATRDALKASIDLELTKIKISDLDPVKESRAAAREAKNLTQSAKKTDAREAVFSARRRLYHELKANAEKKLQEEVNKDFAKWRTLQEKDDRPSSDKQYLVQVQNVLRHIGVPTRLTFPDGISLRKFLQEEEEKNGYTIDVSEEILSLIDTPLDKDGLSQVNFQEMTYEQYVQIHNLVNDLLFYGKKKNEIFVDGTAYNLAEVQDELAASISEGIAANGIKKRNEAEGDAGTLKTMLRNALASHWRIPALLRSIEGTQFGYFWNYIIKPGDAAKGREQTLQHEYTLRMAEALAPLLRETKNRNTQKRITYDNGLTVKREEILAMALNMGNTENMQRLVDGLNADTVRNPDGTVWTPEALTAFIGEELSDEELKAVQNVWNVYDKLRPLIEEKEIRVYGRPPVWVKANAVTFAHPDGSSTTLKGGYYPITYDRVLSAKADELKAGDDIKQAMAANFRSATASRAHLKKRGTQGLGSPLNLTLNAGLEGLDAAIHELCWQEWEINARKIFNADSKTGKMIRDYFGTEAEKAIKQWMEDIAVGNANMAFQGNALASFLRKNISLAGLGFNVLTSIVQIPGLIQTAGVIGTKWMLLGFKAAASRGVMGAIRYAQEASPEMANRTRTRFRELVELEAEGRRGGNLLQVYQANAYKMIVMMQSLVDIPTWYGAREKYLAEGYDVTEAEALASRTLVDAQGSGDVFDLSGIERGNDFAKLMTVFYTFFNTTLNACRMVKNTEKTATAFFSMFLMLVIQPMTESFLRTAILDSVKSAGQWGDDDDDFWLKALRAGVGNTIDFNLGLFVGLREFSGVGDWAAGHLFGENTALRGYSGPSGFRKVQDINKFVAQLPRVANGEADLATFKAINNVFGSFFGLPSAQINKTATGAKAIYEGKANAGALFLGYSDSW